MRLQSVILPENADIPELYYRGALSLNVGETLSFDTYYNSFCYTKYLQYTKADSVYFTCRFNGMAIVRLCVFDGEEQIIAQSEGEGSITLSIRFSRLPENGFLYPKITAITNCIFIGGEYSAECVPEDIRCCIAICTFKREGFVLKNTKLLKDFDFSYIERVFVIDNGHTLNCRELSDNFVKVLPNRNYGGSGGFTRGLIEAYNDGFSHVILMDDDVEFLPQTLEQMTVFMSLLKKEYSKSWFSAAMLPLDKPWEQYELGAEWNGKESIVHKHNVDIRKREILLDNLNNPGVEYGGWWTICMPVSVVENGLPYPFFIKFDDAEYGMRNSAEIITMNGVAVRHEAFDRKTGFTLDYYNLRNELVVNSIYKKYGAFGAVKRFWYEVWKELLLYRYDNCGVVFRAVRDFLGGADFFLSCDEEKLNGELMNSVLKLQPLSEIPGWNEKIRSDSHQKNNVLSHGIVLTLGGHLIPAFMLDKMPYAIPLSKAGMADIFGRKEVIQYQLGGNVGILTKRNVKKFFYYLFWAIGISAKLLFGFKRAQNSLIMGKHKLTSMEFWKNHLGI